ncbi:predicted protein [Chaetomium globosum CBS 148.51]|uniref:Infection structure specific protein n=1 Tax=Chaetomium globosum (strain ATCC 6205 / CBS 148.51 / DSM 1962 / NBRC 6347 / NRRL 1970) TaxID=306901 RepID=Q2HC93_CHAGB|nr:uncharacterized protein CHGG_02161 [Chaetomium globosum CBS 148.51]EAQ90226.1 predicted protein [Chaetomium globosum CBS 148.51]
MQIRTALVTVAFGVSTSALVHPAAPPLPPVVTPAPLVARGDQAASLRCSNAIEPFTEANMPRPTRSLASWLVEHEDRQGIDDIASAFVSGSKIDNGEIDRVCPLVVATLTPPASLASAYSTYTSQMSSWQASVAPIASSAMAQCTGEGQLGLLGAYVGFIMATDVPQCTNALHGHNAALSSANTAKPGYVAAVVSAASLVAAIVIF